MYRGVKGGGESCVGVLRATFNHTCRYICTGMC